MDVTVRQSKIIIPFKLNSDKEKISPKKILPRITPAAQTISIATLNGLNGYESLSTSKYEAKAVR